MTLRRDARVLMWWAVPKPVQARIKSNVCDLFLSEWVGFLCGVELAVVLNWGNS